MPQRCCNLWYLYNYFKIQSLLLEDLLDSNAVDVERVVTGIGELTLKVLGNEVFLVGDGGSECVVSESDSLGMRIHKMFTLSECNCIQNFYNYIYAFYSVFVRISPRRSAQTPR